jgi:hypothetical protein
VKSTYMKFDDDLAAVVPTYPSQREAASMLRVSASALSRFDQVESVQVGGRGKHYSPAAVLVAGTFYKKRSLNEIAAELMDYARQHGSDEAMASAKSEIDDFFVNRTADPVDRDLFLRQARRSLPGPLYREVKRAVEHGVPVEPELVSAAAQGGLNPLQP